MTKSEFRVKALWLMAKAEFINENMASAKVEINLSLLSDKVESYYMISISMYEYGSKIHYVTFSSANYNAMDLLRDMSDMLDGYIEGVKEVI